MKGKGAGTGRLGRNPAAGENRTGGAGPGGWEKTKRIRNEKTGLRILFGLKNLRMRDAVGWERTDGEDDREMKRDGKSWMRNVMSVRADARRRWM